MHTAFHTIASMKRNEKWSYLGVAGFSLLLWPRIRAGSAAPLLHANMKPAAKHRTSTHGSKGQRRPLLQELNCGQRGMSGPSLLTGTGGGQGWREWPTLCHGALSED